MEHLTTSREVAEELRIRPAADFPWGFRWQPVTAALFTSLAYYLGAKLGSALTIPPSAISVLWPPNSILLSALLMMPRRWWWLTVALVFPSHLLSLLDAGVPLLLILGWFVSNTSEALIGAFCVTQLLAGPPVFDKTRDLVVFFAFAALLAPFLTSFLDAVFVSLAQWGGHSYWQIWRARFFSNVATILTVVPMIVIWLSRTTTTLTLTSSWRIMEWSALLCGLIFVGFIVFNSQPAGAQVNLALLYLPLPFMFWAAARFGPAGTSMSFVLLALSAIWGESHGRGPFTANNPETNVLTIQLFLSFSVMGLLSLATVIAERRLSQQSLYRSEQRYRAVLEQQTEMVCRYLPDSSLTFVNHAFCKFYERSQAQLLGRKFVELMPESVQSTLLYRIECLSRDKQPMTCEYATSSSDGATRWQQWLTSVIEDQNGHVIELQATGRDITDARRKDETLRDSEERFQLVLQATKVAIYERDIRADTLWWSRNGLALFGYVLHDTAHDGSWWADRLHLEDQQRVLARLNDALQGDASTCSGEYRFRRADGSYAWVAEHACIQRDATGKASRMIGSVMDVTDTRRIDEVNERLVHASRLAVLGELTAAIAHEINQPLGAILSNTDAAEILLNTSPIKLDELRLILEDIRRDDTRAGDVIRQIKVLSRRRELVVEPFDVNRALAEVLNLVSADLTNRRISVATNFAKVPTVVGDRVRLQQVLMNLIQNGVDAMANLPQSRRCLEIRTSRSWGGGVEVRISDNGPGVPAERVEELFESFFTTKPDGMGLGLAIARSIIETHGGRIWEENRPEGGASFCFILPGEASPDMATQMPKAN